MIEIIGVVLGAILAVIGGIVVWRWTRERRIIQVSVWSSTPTRLKDGTYRSQSVRYENVGNKAVKDLEVDIRLADGGKVEKVVLDGLLTSLEGEGESRLHGGVPLLNPGEATQLVLTTSDCHLTASARAEDVEVRVAPRKSTTPLMGRIVGVGILVLLGLAVVQGVLEWFGVVPKAKSEEERLVDRLDNRLQEVVKKLDAIDTKLGSHNDSSTSDGKK